MEYARVISYLAVSRQPHLLVLSLSGGVHAPAFTSLAMVYSALRVHHTSDSEHVTLVGFLPNLDAAAAVALQAVAPLLDCVTTDAAALPEHVAEVFSQPAGEAMGLGDAARCRPTGERHTDIDVSAYVLAAYTHLLVTA